MIELEPGALAYQGLDASALEALSTLRAFAEREIIPVARALDAADAFPEEIVDGLRERGVFGFKMCQEVVLDAMRIHGGNGYSKGYEVERLYRDAPMLLLGEGTSEIQRTIVARGLTRRREEQRDGT